MIKSMKSLCDEKMKNHANKKGVDLNSTPLDYLNYQTNKALMLHYLSLVNYFEMCATKSSTLDE
ncbi:MAG: hypothetical protein CL600_13640 [Alteromonas sp.]|nr:hypothetical protein [Alteromonas sp.]